MKLFDFDAKVSAHQCGKNYEPDSSPQAWKLFKEVYVTRNWACNFDFKNINTYNNLLHTNYDEKKYERLYVPSIETETYNGVDTPKFLISGETDFNFNDDDEEFKRTGKSTFFRNIIGNNTDALRLLEECRNSHCTLKNFSLMASTGALGNFKGSYPLDGEKPKYGYDRLDAFINKIDEFLQGKNEDILCKAKGENKGRLRKFLKTTFCDVYDYCNNVYFISDKTFVNKLIDNGKKPIITDDDVIVYMKLAKDYWNLKKQAYNKILNQP